MSFNFGCTPFKHSFPKNAIAMAEAPAKNVRNNAVGQASDSANANIIKISDAPKAIIIEVLLLHTIYINCKLQILYCFIQPSRELAEQTFNQIIKFKKHLGAPEVRELLVIGGMSAKDQMLVLQKGVDIIVGTPGRLEDLIQGGS